MYVTVALDAAGIALVFPVLPGLLRTMTGRHEVSAAFGAMLALYAFMQFVFAPVIGVLSDRFGRRPVLLVSLAGSVLDYLIMAFTPYLWLLFVGRAMAGLTGAHAAVATACVTDVTPEAGRGRRFGLLQAFFGAGFVAGPLIGGVLGDISPRDPFLAAAVLNGANLLLALAVLPETRQAPAHQAPPDHAPPPPAPPDRALPRRPWAGRIDMRAMNPLAPLRWALDFPALTPLLVVFLLISLAGQTYTTVWVLFTEDRFGWTGAEVGASLSLFGALVVLAQALAVGPVMRRLGERRTLILGLICEAATMLVLAFAGAGWVVFAVIPALAFGGIGLPALRALQANAVGQDRQGRLQGIVASCAGLATILGPLVFSWIYALSRPRWTGLVWVIAVAVHAIALAIVRAVPGDAGRTR